MIYLSIQSASTSLKENLEVNGSICDPKITSELKILLERYAKLLGFSLSDAIDIVLGVSGGTESSEVCLFVTNLTLLIFHVINWQICSLFG